jgi:hypothetical protein
MLTILPFGYPGRYGPQHCRIKINPPQVSMCLIFKTTVLRRNLLAPACRKAGL